MSRVGSAALCGVTLVFIWNSLLLLVKGCSRLIKTMTHKKCDLRQPLAVTRGIPESERSPLEPPFDSPARVRTRVCKERAFVRTLFELFNRLSLLRPPADDCWPWLNITFWRHRGQWKMLPFHGTARRSVHVMCPLGVWVRWIMRKIKTDGAKKQPCSVSNGSYCVYILYIYIYIWKCIKSLFLSQKIITKVMLFCWC